MVVRALKNGASFFEKFNAYLSIEIRLEAKLEAKKEVLPSAAVLITKPLSPRPAGTITVTIDCKATNAV